MVVKPVGSRKSMHVDMKMVSDCWDWCWSAYDRGRNSWSNSKQWVRRSIEYVWFLFLALVSSESNEQRKFSVTEKEQKAVSEELMVVKVEKDISVIVDQDEEAQDAIGREEETRTIDVETKESTIESTVENFPAEEELTSIRSTIQRKEFKPYTIVEEDEDSEEDIEEKEKQWRASNGGLARFAAIENLAFRSEPLSGDESLDLGKNEADRFETTNIADGQDDDLWQSLVAKYTDEPQESYGARDDETEVSSQKMEFKVGCSDEQGQQEPMSTEEFSAAVGRRLSEIIALEEEKDEIILGEDSVIDQIAEIEKDGIVLNESSNEYSVVEGLEDAPKIEFDENIDLREEKSIFTQNSIGRITKDVDEDDTMTNERFDGYSTVEAEQDRSFQTLFVHRTIDDQHENDVMYEESDIHEGDTKMNEFEEFKSEIQDSDVENYDNLNSSENIDDSYPSMTLQQEKVDAGILKSSHLDDGYSQKEEIKDENATEREENKIQIEIDDLDQERSTNYQEVCSTNSEYDGTNFEDEPESEVAVVADFCFKLRPKEKDKISFTLKEEMVKDASLISSYENEVVSRETPDIVYGDDTLPISKTKQESETSEMYIKSKSDLTTGCESSEPKENSNIQSASHVENEVDDWNDKENEISLQEDLQKVESNDLIEQMADQNEETAVAETVSEMKPNVSTDIHIEPSCVDSDLVQPVDNKLVSFLLQGSIQGTLESDEEPIMVQEISGIDLHLGKEEVGTPSVEESFGKADISGTVFSFALNNAQEEKIAFDDEPNLLADALEESYPQTEKCKTRVTKTTMREPIVRDKVSSFHLHEAVENKLTQECDMDAHCEPVEGSGMASQEFAAHTTQEPLEHPVIGDPVKSLKLEAAIEREDSTEFENKPRTISSKKLSQSNQDKVVATAVVEDALALAAEEIQPLVNESVPDEREEMSSIIPVPNLFSDIVVDDTYNMILDKEASLEAEDDTSSIKRGILDTTVYEFDSNFDSKDIFDEKEVDEILLSNNENIDDVKEGDTLNSIPEYLSDIEDLISVRKSNVDDGSNISIGETVDDNKEWSFTPGLTAEEEAELAELAEIDQDQSEMDFKQFMSMSANLTQQELEELAEFEEEKQSAQVLREAERKELEKFLEMPAGLTEQEQAELSDLLSNDLEEAEISKATEERLAAFLAAARAESGFSDYMEEEPLEKYMNLPVGLTEEEERMLREGTDGEVDLIKDEEYREEIRKRFLENLDEDEDMVLLDEYEFTEQYGSDYELEYDDDYDGDDLNGTAFDVKKSETVLPKNSKNETKSPEEKSGLPVAPPRKSKTSDGSKMESKPTNTESRAGPSKSAKTEKDGKDAKDVKNKKFFRLGALGTKRKKKTHNTHVDGGELHTNYKTVRKKGFMKNIIMQRNDSGYFSSFGNDSTNEPPFATPDISSSYSTDISSHTEHFQPIQPVESLLQEVEENLTRNDTISHHSDKLLFCSQSNKFNNIPSLEKTCNSNSENVCFSDDVHPKKFNDPLKDEVQNGKIERRKKRRKKQRLSVKNLVAKFSKNEETDKKEGILNNSLQNTSVIPDLKCTYTTEHQNKEEYWPVIADEDGKNRQNEESDFNLLNNFASGKLDENDLVFFDGKKFSEGELPKHSEVLAISKAEIDDTNSTEIDYATGLSKAPIMAAVDDNTSNDWDAEDEVEERQEVVENPDGTVTIKTIKTTTSYVEVEEDEDGEEEEEIIEEEVVTSSSKKNDDEFGADGMKQLTQAEMEEFMMLQAERKWLDTLGEGGEQQQQADNDEKKKKKKRGEGEKKGKKKKKKGDGKENKKDLLAKHVGPRVRSFDSAKMRTKFEKPKETVQVSSNCRACGKQVFQMEKIVAEKASWHKSCFKCTECDKVLTLETYQSHEGSLYCKPHFKQLFRPKAVVEDPAEARKERLLRRPKMIVLESNPEVLPDDVVRATSKPDYGLEELSNLNVKQRFSMFEATGQEEEDRRPEPAPVRRSQSLISRAARFLQENGTDDYGVSNEELGEFEEDDEENEEECDDEEEEEVEEEEEGVDENGEPIIVKTTKKKKKSKPNAGDLKGMFEKRQRRDEMTKQRKEELGRFRQMLCAGKNISLKERFESGQFENEEKKDKSCKEEIKIDEKRSSKSLKAKFEKGQPFILDEEEADANGKYVGEKQEVEEVFKDAETANRARNLFKQIDSKVNQDGSATILRSQSFACSGSKDNRKSFDFSGVPLSPRINNSSSKDLPADIVRAHDQALEEETVQVDSRDLASKFMFFATFEERAKEESHSKKKVFRMTPPREGIENQGIVNEEVELGRDPNLIKSTDNYQDEVDCRNTRSILNMFKKMEAKNCLGEEDEEDDEGEYDSEEYSDEEYSDEEYSDEEDEEGEGEEGNEENGAQYKDDVLQMLSAKKAAQLRAKFEKWEDEEARQNGINSKGVAPGGSIEEEAMPSLDTARNLKAMFEEKAQEAAKPLVRERAKVNRFV